MTTTADAVAWRSAVSDLLAAHPPGLVSEAAFLAAQFDAGLAWPHHPVGSGGRGWPTVTSIEVQDALRAGGAPNGRLRNPIGYGMAAPVLMALAEPGRRGELLRALFTGEHVWCQAFTEPGAGSDLASVATEAVPDGSSWRLTGHKTWTSFADSARYALVLARSDPEVPRHAGLSLFALDMRSPGVTVRPLRQLTGNAEFSEVILEDVLVPDGDRLGPVGEGWAGAKVALAGDRAVAGGGTFKAQGAPIDLAMALWRERPAGAARRAELARHWSTARIVDLMEATVADRTLRSPPHLAALVKLLRSESTQRTYAFCVDLLGAGGMLLGPAGERVVENPQWMFLRSQSFTIGGGTSNIIRNTLAERGLGLPREPGPS